MFCHKVKVTDIVFCSQKHAKCKEDQVLFPFKDHIVYLGVQYDASCYYNHILKETSRCTQKKINQ